MDTSARARELALLGIETRATQSQNTGNTGGSGGKTAHEPKGSPKGGQFTANPSGGGGYKSILPPDSGYKSGGGGKKKAATAAPQAPATPRTMKSGDSGEDVRYAQYAMNLLGFKVAQDGNYGPETEAAVKQIQARLGVKKPNGHLSAAQLHKLQDAVRLSPCIGAGQRDLEAEAQWEARFAELEDEPDLDEDGMTEAVTDALDEFVARSFWGDWEERAHDVSGELRIPGGVGGGRWTKSPVTAAILKALKEAKGPDSFTLDGKPIDREPLRKAAVARGIKLPRGASRDDIVKALLADVGKGGGEKAAPSAPSPRVDAKAKYAAVAQSRPYASAAAAIAELTAKKQSNAVIAEHVRAIAHPDSPDMAEIPKPSAPNELAPDLRGPTARVRHNERDDALVALNKSEHGLPASGGALYETFQILEHMGYVRHDGNGPFRLTDKGREYIAARGAPKAPASTAAHDLEQVAAAFEAGNPALGKRRMTAALKKQGITQGPGGTVPFDPAAHEHLGAASAEQVREVVVENKIRAAYRAAPKGSTGFASLADVRERVGNDVPRSEVDAALKRLAISRGPGDANVVPESNQKTLTAADHAAAVHFGDQAKHAIHFDDASPQPLPGAPAAGTPVSVVRPGMSLHRDEGDHVQLSKAVVMSAPGASSKATPVSQRVNIAGQDFDLADLERRSGLAGKNAQELGDIAYEANITLPSAAKSAPARRLFLITTAMEHAKRNTGNNPELGLRHLATSVERYDASPRGAAAAAKRAPAKAAPEAPKSPAEILSSLPADLTPAQRRARLRSRGVSKAEIDALVPLKSATKAPRTPLGPGGADDLAEEFYRHPKYTEQQIHDRLAGLNLAELKKVATATNVGLPRDLIKTEAGPVFQPLKKISADDLRKWIAAKIAGDRKLLANEDKFTNAARSQDLDEVDDEPDDDEDYDDEPSPLELQAMAGGSTARARELALLGIETRALGHDVTPGHDELHHYWTVGPGLAKWAESPKPWTTLVAHLTKYVGPEKAKIYASRWFIEVFHFAAGSDLNRVTHGKPPRGHRVGPG